MADNRISGLLAAILTATVEDRVGLHYEGQDVDVFSGKLSARAHESGFKSLLDYYYFLRYDDADGREFDALVDALVVNETYFFREAGQLRTLITEILAPLHQKGQRARVWCAACSTGEEPLTLAMLLAERNMLDAVDILASDVSSRALARAREGVYRGRSLRAITPEERRAWLIEDGEVVKVRREIHDAIVWERLNLLDEAAIAKLGRFDAILCRNVLIYFHERTVVGVISRLADALAVGGRLLVGASESLMRFGTALECEERAGAFFYRRPPHG
jgi:chemotaxis protein methyltransferase CheR